MKLTLPDIRGSSMTAIGAISERRGLILYHIIQGSNNAETFEKFITDLKAMVTWKKTIVVLDNLSVHKAKRVRAHFDFGFQELYLPPYSCELNPIERLWAVVKGTWRKEQHHYA